MKIVTIVGARPQFIKVAPVSRALNRFAHVREVLVHTGQHYDSRMSDVFFEQLGIRRPEHQLSIGSGSHAVQTGQMLIALEEVLEVEQPDIVLVYGDTNSTLAGALVAAKLNIPVAHVEAGLRSFNRKMPEEVNRVVTDHLSTFLFAPTVAACANLRHEGFEANKIHHVGDVMLDAAMHFSNVAESRSDTLNSLTMPLEAYVLATVHRAENTDDSENLLSIFDSLCDVRVATQLQVLVPLHPRTTKALRQLGRLEYYGSRLTIVEPLSYLEMIHVTRHARLVVTDSGGLQKEAFFFNVPCVVVRHETEWTELVDAGWIRLAPPTDRQSLVSSVLLSLNSQPEPLDPSPYGTGVAADRIADVLVAGARDEA